MLAMSFLLLIFVVIAVAPYWPYSRAWGFRPISVLLTMLAVLLVLVWLGAIAAWQPWDT